MLPGGNLKHPADIPTSAIGLFLPIDCYSKISDCIKTDFFLVLPANAAFFQKIMIFFLSVLQVA